MNQNKKPLKQRKPKLYLLSILLSLSIIGYAMGLKYAPEYMPFNLKSGADDFYAPHAGYCVPELEF